MLYFFSFASAALLSFLTTIAIKKIAIHFDITDKPNSPRKIHNHPIPLLGGLGAFAAFWVVILVLAQGYGLFPARYISSLDLWAIFIGGLLLMLGGFIDDKYNIAPRYQLIFVLLAVLVILSARIGISFVTNPLGGGLWHLDQWRWGSFIILADAFTVLWLMGTMYTTKLLDGLDGLVSGITVISAFIIFALSLTHKTYQPDVALLAIVLAGAVAGFLIWNFHPAKIFLGEGGSVWVGFMLGVLAIISGGKVATALLVMGVPILDVAWVIVRRVLWEKKSLGESDAKHLHFRLLTAGLSQRKSVLVLWGFSALFGVTSLFLQTRGKVYSLLILLFVTIILALWVTKRSKQSQSLPRF